MHLFILRWNPNISSYKTEDHLTLINHIENGEQPNNFNWDIREYSNLEKNDMFILQQVGTEHDGIAMIGKFKNTCYEEESWRNDGSIIHYADMWIMDAFDCDHKNPLPANRYEELFPEIQWHGGHSGVLVEEDLDDNIINKIEEDLIKAKIWQKGNLDQFMAWDFEKEIADNKILLDAKNRFLKDKNEKNLANFIGHLLDAKVLMPMHVEKNEHGETMCFPVLIKNNNDESAYTIFSNESQIGDKSQDPDYEYYEIPVPLAIDIVKEDENTNSLILDPYTKPYLIDKEMINELNNIRTLIENKDK